MPIQHTSKLERRGVIVFPAALGTSGLDIVQQSWTLIPCCPTCGIEAFLFNMGGVIWECDRCTTLYVSGASIDTLPVLVLREVMSHMDDKRCRQWILDWTGCTSEITVAVNPSTR